MLERKLELLSKAGGAPTFAVSSEKVAVKLIVSNPGWPWAQHTVGILASGGLVQWDGWRLAQGLESFRFFVSLILVTESPFSCTTQAHAGGWGVVAEAEITTNSELSRTPGVRRKCPFPTQLSNICIYFVMHI